MVKLVGSALSTEGEAVVSLQNQRGTRLSANPSDGLRVRQEATLGRVVGAIPGVGLGAIDTIGQSFGLLDDTSVQRSLSAVGLNGFSEYYAANSDAFRAGGDLITLFAAGTAGVKALRAVQWARQSGQIGSWAKNSASAAALLGNSARLTALEQTASTALMNAARSSGAIAGRTVLTPEVITARRALTTARLVDSVRTTTAFELFTQIPLRESDLFHPADETLMDNAKWTGAGYVIGGGIEFAAARFAFRGLVRGAMTAAVGESAGSREATKLAGLISRPQERGVAATQIAMVKENLRGNVDQLKNEVLRSNIRQDFTFLDQNLVRETGYMFSDPHVFVSPMTTTKEIMTNVVSRLEAQPDLLLYATKMGRMPESKRAFYSGVQSAQEAAQRDIDTQRFILGDPNASPAARRKAQEALVKAQDTAAEINSAAEEVHYVLEPGGEFSVYANRADNWLDFNSFENIKRAGFDDVKPGTQDKMRRSRLQIADTNIHLQDDFTVVSVTKEEGRNVVAYNPALNQKTRSALFAASSKFIKDWRPVEGQLFEINENMPWFQLEGLLELSRVRPEAASAMQFKGALKNWDDVELAILSKKYADFNRMMDITERNPVTAAIPKRLRQNMLDPADVLHSLNMPAGFGPQQHPLISLFAQMRMSGVDDLGAALQIVDPTGLRNITSTDGLDALQHAMKNIWDDTGQTAFKLEFRLRGNLHRQIDQRPIFVAAKSVPSMPTSEAIVLAMAETRRDLQLANLAAIDPNEAPMVANTVKSILTSNYTAAARQVDTLVEGELSSRGRVTEQARANNQHPAVQAQALLAQYTDAISRAYVKDLMKAEVTPLYSAITQRANQQSLVNFNRVNHAYRHGWNITKATAPDETGRYLFELAGTPHNAQLKARYFPGVNPEEITHLPDMSITSRRAENYSPISVDKLAHDMAMATSKLSRQSGVENNVLRRALGLKEIPLRDFHLPSPALQREGTQFVRDDTGQVVATYMDDNARFNERNAQAASRKLTEVTGRLHTAVPMEDVRRSHGIFDDNIFKVLDFSDQILQDGTAMRGGLTRAEVDISELTLRNMLDELSEQYLRTSVRARTAIFEPQIRYARMAAEATGDVSKGINVFDRYNAAAFSRLPVAENDSTKQIYGSIEDFGDQVITYLRAQADELNQTSPAVRAVGTATKRLLRKQTSESAYKEFQKLNDWSPFDETTQWLESTYRAKTPVDVRRVASALARTSSTLTLRVLDHGMALLNLLSPLTNSPAVLHAMRPRPGETRAQYELRTGAVGTRLLPENLDGTPQFKTFSIPKAMASVTRGLWNGEFSAPMKRAAKMGLFDPEYLSLDEALNTATHQKGALERFTEFASKAADKSEIISRKWAWAIGYKMAKDLHGMEDDANAFIYAMHVVNDTIGNYSQINKPAMFSGSTGMILGAFQTYMFNYYRRVFGYIENKNVRALAVQYASQASLFGASGTPGFSAFNNMLYEADSGETFSNRLDKQVPEGVAELLLHGSLSGIPAIFGVDAPALYTRGSVDANRPPPTLVTWNQAPSVQFLSNTFQGVQKSLSNIFSEQGFSTQRQMEILSLFGTNRALKSIAETVAGEKVDRTGQVIDDNTRQWVNIAAAMVGTVPVSVRRAQDTYYQQDSVEASQQAIRTRLNDQVRAAFRTGSISLEDLQASAGEYLRSGGNPAYFGSWLRQSYITATTPKIQTKLDQLLNSGKGQEFINMLAGIQALDGQSPALERTTRTGP